MEIIRHGDHTEKGICYLVLHDLGIFQVCFFDVLNLEELENLLVFCLCFCLM